MKKFFTMLCIFALTAALSPVFAYDAKDYKAAGKIAKKMRKLTDKGKTKELQKFYSNDYKSFDGYDKDAFLKIVDAAYKLYPNIKTKEKITKIEDENDLIKVYVNETAVSKINIEGEDTEYALQKRVKGKLTSSSSYAIFFKKEEDGLKVVADEIFEEQTEIMYGEAMKTDFSIETPSSITPGSEYAVKTFVEVPEDRLVVGSIGHDKIVYPPEKLMDPYRAIDKTGILERIMVANKDGKNEYANSTFAFISSVEEINEGQKIKAAISGMGICVKRINVIKEQDL